VRFDGRREADGTMLEAKGPGYASFLDGQGGWRDWFTRLERMQSQMEDQSDAAAERLVEWHFAEQPVADYFRGYAHDNKLFNIIVLYTPPR
jgi:filamentous hemagglutinin